MPDRSGCRPLRHGLLVSLAGLLAVSLAAAQGPSSRGLIWSVERDGRTSWLVGSLHALPPDAHPLPVALDAAFRRAVTLVEETDLDDAQSPDVMATIASTGLFTGEASLESVLAPEVYARLVQRAETAGLPIEMARRMRPWLATLTLASLDLQRAGFDPALGVDVYFRRKADAAGLPFQPLETAVEQIAYLVSLPVEVQTAQLQHALDGDGDALDDLRDMAEAWRTGDAGALDALLARSRTDEPVVYQALVVARNRRWLPRIETCLTAGGCFVVVGAAHLVGTDGLVAMLAQRGYRLTQQ